MKYAIKYIQKGRLRKTIKQRPFSQVCPLIIVSSFMFFLTFISTIIVSVK